MQNWEWASWLTNMTSCLKCHCWHCFCRMSDRKKNDATFPHQHCFDSPRAHLAPKTLFLPRTLVMLQRQHQLLLKEWWMLQRKRCSTAESVWSALSWLWQCQGEQQHVHYGLKLWDAYIYIFFFSWQCVKENTRDHPSLNKREVSKKRWRKKKSKLHPQVRVKPKT